MDFMASPACALQVTNGENSTEEQAGPFSSKAGKMHMGVHGTVMVGHCERSLLFHFDHKCCGVRDALHHGWCL